MKKDASMKAMMNGFIEKGTKTAELKPYGLKTYFSLPPYVNDANRAQETAPSTRRFGPNNRDVTERGDEETIHPQRILDLYESKGSTEAMKSICRKAGLPIGTKAEMRDAMLKASGSIDTEMCKNFASITSKSGGLLHGHCQHGFTYLFKILVLPEGVSDYTQCIMSMNVLPTMVISDIAHILARHTNRNYGSDIFWPHDGRISDPDNKERTEDIKGGKCKVNFEFIPQTRPFDEEAHDQRLSPNDRTHFKIECFRQIPRDRAEEHDIEKDRQH